jgi:hypothetical protein
MAETSLRHELPLLVAGQAHKEIVHNEALIRLDALVATAVVAIADEPPPAPVFGQCWIVGSAPTGAWTPHPGEIALWQTGGWLFLSPTSGLLAWHLGLQRFIYFDGVGWVTGSWPAAAIEISGKTILSGQFLSVSDPSGGSVVDVEARAAVNAILGVLRDHGLIAA